MMPDLPNVGVERDLESFKEFFESPSFRADGLKIYPTLVIRGTGLYELWKTGRYALCFPIAYPHMMILFAAVALEVYSTINVIILRLHSN